MKQLTKNDLKEALKEAGVVTKSNFGELLNEHGVATKKDLSSFATKKDLSSFATKKDLAKFATKRDLNKMKKELITVISGVAVNSPTSDQFYKLEKRVSALEPIVS